MSAANIMNSPCVTPVKESLVSTPTGVASSTPLSEKQKMSEVSGDKENEIFEDPVSF